MAREKARRLTQAEFYNVCESLKSIPANELNYRSYEEVAKVISEKIGTEVSDKSVIQAAEATGISWEHQLPRKLSTKEHLHDLERRLSILEGMLFSELPDEAEQFKLQ